MWIFHLYRFYLSVGAGVLVYVAGSRTLWQAVLAVVLFRTGWFLVEQRLEHIRMERSFRRHATAFKQALGPYGIRLINKAETDPRTKRSLAEVFTPNPRALRRTVEQLEMLNTLFDAGMRPAGDEYLLHDCKLKYGRMRLQRMENKPARDTARSGGEG
jgi:hypothetical protein